MDPIISEYLTTLVTRMQALSSGTYTAASEQQLKSLISATISEYATKYGTTNPEAVMAIRSLNSPEMVAKYAQGATFISEAAKSGVPTETARALVREALVNGTPIGQTTSSIAPELDQAVQQARQSTRDFLTNAAKSQAASPPSPISSSPVESFVSARRYLPPGSVDVTSTVAAAESAAPAVTQNVARVLVPKVEETSSGTYKFISSIIPGLYGLLGKRSVQTAGVIAGGVGLAALLSESRTPSTPASTSSPDIPIGPSAMQNLPSASATVSEGEKELQALRTQLEASPDSPNKWQAWGTLTLRRIAQLEGREAQLVRTLDSTDPNKNPTLYSTTYLELTNVRTNIEKEHDNWAQSQTKYSEAVKLASENSPENLDLLARAKEAQIAASNASAAASTASAANSRMQTAIAEFNLAQAQELGPTALETAKQTLRNMQLQVATSEVQLKAVQTEAEQKAAVNILSEKYNQGEISEEDFITQSLSVTGNIAALATHRLELQKAKDARAQAQITQGNWEKSFGLQEQQAALAQTEAVASREFRQAQLDLQKTQEARAAAQARAQNIQALSALQTRRQEAFNQASTEYERFGVATPGRIQGLQDLRAPLPAAQAAGMLGLDVNSPEFKAVYDTYSMALAPGQGAQQPAPVAPAPGPNPVSTGLPLISMPNMASTPYLTQALNGLRTGYSPA